MSNRRHLAFLAALLTVAMVTAASATAAPTEPTPAVYAGAVTEICATAVLFEGTHPIGTRAGALEVAADIRDTSRLRLALVAALPEPSSELQFVTQWLALEQRLADTYARNYVRIYDIIAAPSIRRDYARARHQLQTLLQATDSLSGAASLLEQQLHVPDCIGG
jgi:hypothetical protein